MEKTDLDNEYEELKKICYRLILSDSRGCHKKDEIKDANVAVSNYSTYLELEAEQMRIHTN